MNHKDRKEQLFGLLIAAITFLAYANSLGNGFTLDDFAVIVNNSVLKGDIASIFSTIDTVSDSQMLPLYRPITYLSYLIESRLHAFNPFYIRLFNVLLHSANAYLVFRLAYTLFKENIYAALLTSILFAVHPVNTEGVDFNAGGRNTMLACFFSISAFLIHCKNTPQNQYYRSLIGAVFFLAGLLSKESALMVLPFIAYLEVPQFRSGEPGSRFRSVIKLTPYFVATVIYLVMRWQTLSKFGIQTSIIPGIGNNVLESLYVIDPLATRLLNNLYIIPRYLLVLIWPNALCPRYTIPEDLNLLALPISVAWLFILSCLWWIVTRGRSAASMFGLAWLIFFWLPVSGLFIIPIPLAERYLYIPAIGIWIIVSDQVCALIQKGKPAIQKYLLVTLTFILIILTSFTIRRNFDWENNISLFSRFVQQYPENIHAQAGIGIAYWMSPSKRNHPFTERQLEKVVALEPSAQEPQRLLGHIKLAKNDYEGALQHYSKALEILPYDKESRLNRGIVLEKLNKPEEALNDYLSFLTSPGNSDNLPGGRQHAEERIRVLSK